MRRPINWNRLRLDEAEGLIRSRSRPDKTGNVIFTNHAEERMEERGITRHQAMTVLRGGQCSTPKLNDKGDWEVLVSKKIAGSRDVGVATVIVTVLTIS